jgi:hypothetical protein
VRCRGCYLSQLESHVATCIQTIGSQRKQRGLGYLEPRSCLVIFIASSTFSLCSFAANNNMSAGADAFDARVTAERACSRVRSLSTALNEERLRYDKSSWNPFKRRVDLKGLSNLITLASKLERIYLCLRDSVRSRSRHDSRDENLEIFLLGLEEALTVCIRAAS